MPSKPAQAIERVVPHSLEAEKALLGSVLLDNSALDMARESLQKEDLFSYAHQIIFHRMCELSDKSRAIDLVTLSDELGKDGLLEKSGGAVYLSALTDCAPIGSSAAMGEYCRIVKEKSTLRRLIGVSNNVISRAMEGADEPEDLVQFAEQQVFEIGEQKTVSDFQSVGQLFKVCYKNIENLFDRKAVLGVESGFVDLDAMLCGFQPSELTIIAARPSVGKTALALNIACYQAIKGNGVGFFSLEMSRESLLMRIFSAESMVDSHKLRTGFGSKEDANRMMRVFQKLENVPLFINDMSDLSIHQLRSKARRLRAEKKIGLLIVDYLQLVRGGKAETRDQELGNVSRGLKGIAKELGIPVIALCQLSRKADELARPNLGLLRESGNLEADADVVIFIFKKKRKKDEAGGDEDEIRKIFIEKARNGPTGEVDLVWLANYTKFANKASNQYEQPL